MGESVATVELSQDIVRKYIAPKATEQEIYFFLQLCKAQNLNPFLREVYLIKYKDGEPASIVTGKDLFLKRATRNANYAGFKAGVVVQNNKEVVYREGGIVFKGELLVGGWADVYRKDRDVPVRSEVLYEEYVGKKQVWENQKVVGEEPNRQWAAKPGTMIRKVALVQALRESFPDELEGLYSPEEFPHIEVNALPLYDTNKPAEGSMRAPESKSEQSSSPPASEAQKKKIFAILSKLGDVTDGEKHIRVAKILDLDPEDFSFSDITVKEASKVIEGLIEQEKSK